MGKQLNETHHDSDDTESPGKQQQYFSPTPASPDLRHTIPVRILGRDMRLEVSSGVFSANRLDLGTSVLLNHVPAPPSSGNLLDLGCGWGPIALALALSSPKSTVWAVDVNERAVALSEANARKQGLTNIRALTPDQVPEDIRFDVIWSNPPIRIGKVALHSLLETWLARLNEHGVAYLVVQKNLGADSLIAWMRTAFAGTLTVSKYASSKGFRVIEVVRDHSGTARRA